jgi:rod shape-determining protein MreD
MMLPRTGNQLLLPLNPVFLWFSLFLAAALNLIPAGRHPAMPDFLALTLVVWNVHQPRRVGVGWAFAFGLVMDVNHGAVLGQHALSYTVLSFLAVTMHRRLLWFDLWSQALHVLPLFALAHAVALVSRLVAGGMWPGLGFMLSPLIEAALWPLASFLLLAPQRRAPDPDEHRPL